MSVIGMECNQFKMEIRIAKFGTANADVNMQARAPGAPVQDVDSRIPFQLLVILHLLSAFTSGKAKSRPAFVLFFSLVACFFGSPAVANISSMWFSLFSAVFVWMLSVVFGGLPESTARTAIAMFFDYGCAVFIFIVYSELPDRSCVAAVVILSCGILQILHLVYFAAVLVFALFYSAFRWCVPAGNGGALAMAPALNQIAPAPACDAQPDLDRELEL
jgi:hypothetical protein